MSDAMHWLSMNLGDKSYKVCIDTEGFVWFSEFDILANCKIPYYKENRDNLVSAYNEEEWVYLRTPIQEFAFPDGTNLVCLYDEFVYWLSVRFNNPTLAEAIEKFLYIGVDDFLASIKND